MYIKLTIPERLKGLRVERHLTLEQLAAQTGLSKAALGNYETDDYKDVSPSAITTLAQFYGVSADYLLGLTEQKHHPNTEIESLHLSDGMIDLLKSEKINNRLLCEIALHPDFQRLMTDMEIYVDRLASTQIDNLNVYMDTARSEVAKKYHPDENELYNRTMELAHIHEDEYFSYVLRDDLVSILQDIRESHIPDTLTAPETSPASDFQKKIEEVLAAKGSMEETQVRSLCADLGFDYDEMTPEQFVSLIEFFRQFPLLDTGMNRRGKASPRKKKKRKK